MITAYTVRGERRIEETRGEEARNVETFQCEYTGLLYFTYNTDENFLVSNAMRIRNYGLIGEDNFYNSDGDFFICEQCGCNYHMNDYEIDGVCYSCYRENDEDLGTVTISSEEKKKNEIPCRERGEIVRHVRRFGIELEVGGHLGDVFEYLPQGWEIVEDGSINGKEVVSNILQGKAGEEIIKKYLDRVTGTRISTSEGYHLHLDGAGFIRSVKNLKNLFNLYALIEPLFFEYVPRSRQENRYCKKLATTFAGFMFESRKIFDSRLYGTWGDVNVRKRNKYDEARYFWVNFHSLYYRGTFEIRLHSGTFDSNKVLQWVNIHGLLLGLAMQKDFSDNFLKLVKAKQEGGNDAMQEVLFDILKLSETSRDYFRGRRVKFSGNVQEGQGEV